MSSDDKDALHFPAFDATPGEKYRQWRQNLFSYASTKADESGSTLADTLQGIDMGGPLPAAPAYPPGAAGAKMARLRNTRVKSGYGLIYKHISDGDLRTILFTNHFQDGRNALLFLDAAYDTPITRSELREMDKIWTELSISQDVGIQPDSVSRFAKLLLRTNSQRPAANRYNHTELCEKLLEAIAESSRHFNEGAMKEYDAAPGTRQFEYAAAHPFFPGQRDFGSCTQYYDNQWKQAVKSKILTVTGPLRRSGGQLRQATDTARLSRQQMGCATDRPSSPTHTLQALVAAGVELGEDTATTSDFNVFSMRDMKHAMEGSEEFSDFTFEQCYDADGVPSAEIICDNCRGVGHPRRLCPSPRRYRTFDFAISLLRSAKERADARAHQDGRGPGGKRVPPRGQRPPFRPKQRPPVQPRRFNEQAARKADGSELAAETPVDYLSFADEDYFEPTTTQQDQVQEERGTYARMDSPSEPIALGAMWNAWAAVARLLTQLLTLRVVFLLGTLAAAVNVLAAPPQVEELGMLVGQTAFRGVVACVDSGATITCLSEKLAFGGKMQYRVTDKNPKRRLRVASDQLLDIVALEDLTIPDVQGFSVEGGKRNPSTGNLALHNVAAVRGLAEGVILLSVKSLKEHDGVMVYFNDDNSWGVEDCLRLPDGMFVPFVDNTHDVALPLVQASAMRSNDSASLSMRDSPWDVSLRVHAALCHAGATRVQMSNVTYRGMRVPSMPAPHACKGCRLGGARSAPSSTGRQRANNSRVTRAPLEYFGQLVYSDCCTGLPPSFPHGFIGMVNFCDGYSGERDRRFLTRIDSSQVRGALTEYVTTNRRRLKEEKIGTWQTDNGKEFRGECITDAVDDLLDHHDFTVTNNKNSNAIAERDWGIIQRGMRACLAYADNAPQCLWPWAAHQCSMVYHFLATTVHQPPVSPHEFLHPNKGAVDMSWARVLFCDVTVTVPERDVHGKLWHRAADGCHLGYDPRRRGHVVYCPRLRRLGTYSVTDWCGERSFTICHLITADTPVEYHQVEELPMSPTTASLLPIQFRAGRDTIAAEVSVEASRATSKAVRLAATTERSANDICMAAALIDDKLSKLTDRRLEVEVGAPLTLSAALMPSLPDTIEAARQSPWWPMVKDAMEAEIKGKFIDNQAWEVVPRDACMHVIKSKWVLKWTVNDDGSVKEVKARVVACGYSQIAGREYTDVYARTLASSCFRLFCCIVAMENKETDQIDAYKAFTQSDIDCILYVEMPYGFRRAGYVLKLRKALEGIRQGAHLWMEHNKRVLLKLGFQQSATEASLYVHSSLDVIVAVFADDIAAAYDASVEEQYRDLKQQYMAHIRVRSGEITPLSVFIGVAIHRDRERGTVTISQPSYVDQLGKRYEGRFKPRSTPGPTSDVGRREFDKMTTCPLGSKDSVDQVEYLRLIGALIWPASMTRPDIAYYASFLASFNGGPSRAHFDAALNVVGYLVHTRALGITFGGALKIPMGLREMPPGFIESGGLCTYHDSSWGTAAKPYGGYAVMRGNGAISVSARALKIVPDSTAEAETAVASKAAKETVAIRLVAEDIGRRVTGATVLLGDNKASYDIIVKSGMTARTKYFERATLIVKRLYMLLIVTPYLISTKDMVADILTKCVDKGTFFKMRDHMLNLSSGPYASEVQKSMHM